MRVLVVVVGLLVGGTVRSQAQNQAQTPTQAPQDHAAHQPSPAAAAAPPLAGPLPDFIPPLTDADRAAAFPEVMGHTMHDNAVNAFVLFDQLEWQAGGATRALSWDTRGWVGTDRSRLWVRTEGEGRSGRVADAQAHVLYGRRLFRWWDVVAGVRQDVRPGPAQTWAAVGVQGLAPYWFEVEATVYLAASGRTALRLETEYDLLLTNRLILQPLVEMEMFGRADPERRTGAGLSSADAGLRLRYEFRRELAPYLGVTWHRAFFGTADQAAAAGERARDLRLTVGLRLWR
jgi:copper resistance protein B